MERDNSGVLFLNKYKTTDKHPNFKGKAIVNGQEVEMSAWVKEDKNDNEYLSISFQKPYAKVQGTKYKQELNGDMANEFNKSQSDDDLPF